MSTPSKELDLQPFSTRLPSDVVKRLKLYCVKHDIRLQDLIANAIEIAIKEGPDEVS